MSEQNTIPAEILDAGSVEVFDEWVKGKRRDFHCAQATDDEMMYSAWNAALRAAGVPNLAARMASAEQIIASRQNELNIARARIAELEAALRNRICEGCDKLMANMGMLHLCGCRDQRNLCSACKAGCVCAGGGE